MSETVKPFKVRSFKDLDVWQKAFELCRALYLATAMFPSEEKFGLSSELRKTARSVIWNIAEGAKRRSTVEYIRFLDIASGSAGELEAQILLAESLGYFTPLDAARFLKTIDEVERMLGGLMRALEARKPIGAKPG